jgi:predicted transcriptional regulator
MNPASRRALLLMAAAILAGVAAAAMTASFLPKVDEQTMTPAQCRAARALVDMSQAKLADAAIVPATLIADYEAGTAAPRASALMAIKAALERSGVEFIEGGVKLRKSR